jgi:uncharacterized membrane protein HdeD (DUF308 family)
MYFFRCRKTRTFPSSSCPVDFTPEGGERTPIRIYHSRWNPLEVINRTVQIVSLLDEFLEPLLHGIWEIEVPKDSVTEPLDPGWEVSRINVPSPRTIASYRKGQFHAHETKTEWRVHLDNHDPKRHPLLHLIDDAPLLLMIGDTLVTLVSGARNKTGDEQTILAGQTRAWKTQIIIGLIIIIIGLFVITRPWLSFRGTVRIYVPLVMIGLGLIATLKSVSIEPFRILEQSLFYRGLVVTGAGILAFYLPLYAWVNGLLVVVFVWMLASAVMLLRRARKGRTAIPEGFISRVVIAIISLCLAVLMFIYPIYFVSLLMLIGGIVVLLIGVTLLLNGIRLKRRMEGA